MSSTLVMPTQTPFQPMCGGFSSMNYDHSVAEQKKLVEEKKHKEIEEDNTTRTSATFFGTQFELPERYSPIKAVGCGTFGVVISAIDNLTKQKVAIKKLSKSFESAEDARRLLREIKLLKYFNQEENVLFATDIFTGSDAEGNMKDIYLVTDLMETDLGQVIASKQPLTDEHCQCFLYQILRGLQALQKANVVHRDLKPGNILLNGDCSLKICDFGLARVVESLEDDLTDYVATRWYRAPEVILSWKQYTDAIDMWSVGCIFAEILGRVPLFRGSHYLEQVHKIIEYLGTPSEEEILNIKSQAAQDYIRKLPYSPKIPFCGLFSEATPLAIDLLERMLAFDPSKRITVEEALQHPYLKTWSEQEESTLNHPPIDGFEFEDLELSVDEFRELIWKEISTGRHSQPVFQSQAA